MGKGVYHMLLIKIIFALIPLVGIRIVDLMYGMLQDSTAVKSKNILIYIFLLIIIYVVYLTVIQFQTIIYDRFIIQYGYLIEFEKKVKIILHEKCAKLGLKDYDTSSLYQYTYQARVASINIYRSMEIMINIISVCIGMIGIGGYFLRIDQRYVFLLILSSLPTLAEKIFVTSSQKHLRKKIEELNQRDQEYTGMLIYPDFFQENRLLHCFDFLLQKWRKNANEIKKSYDSLTNRFLLYGSVAATIKSVGNGGAFLLAIHFLKQNKDFGMFTATLAAFAVIAGFMERILELIGYLNHFTAMVTPFFNFMELKEEEGREGTKRIEEIVLDNVSFSYSDLNIFAINKVHLRIEKGETIALVGLNGSGKTTLSKLILGLYTPVKGRVLYNLTDTANLDPANKYQIQSAVFQDFCRYPLSVLDNVLISRGNSKKDEILASDCLNKVGVYQKNIAYDTRLGKDLGYGELSGGQWQRLAIARGMYKENELLLLDEPTSAIDPIQEAEIFTLFEELAKERTTIIVTHKLGAIKFVDRIAVLDKGEIAEIGTHSELMMKQGLYADLWKAQKENYR